MRSLSRIIWMGLTDAYRCLNSSSRIDLFVTGVFRMILPFAHIQCRLQNSDASGSREPDQVTPDEPTNEPANESADAPASLDVDSGLRTELEAALGKVAETQDRMLRIAADFENTRKRWDRERQDIRQYSISEFAKDLLPVIDAFDKAMSAVESYPPNMETEEGRRFAAVVEGIQMVSKVFLDAVKKHGIERVSGKGSPFNPICHNAVARTVDEHVEQDTVVEEFVSGYRIGERILRTSMVRVATKD